MLDFARTVFGEDVRPTTSVITESRLTIDEWVGDAPARVEATGWRPSTSIRSGSRTSPPPSTTPPTRTR